MKLTTKIPIVIGAFEANPSPLPWKRNKTTTSFIMICSKFAERFDIVVNKSLFKVS
jgi:hypothetical protein